MNAVIAPQILPIIKKASTPAIAILGMPQWRWPQRALLVSNATWKVIASDFVLESVFPRRTATVSSVSTIRPLSTV
jgi:phosphodiesterase/alkaline phosphatase D-like protein